MNIDIFPNLKLTVNFIKYTSILHT